MVKLDKVLEIGERLPIHADADFPQEAVAISLASSSLREARAAWLQACSSYGYELPGTVVVPQPVARRQPASDLFSSAAVQRPKFWQRVRDVLLPEEWETMWRWAWSPHRKPPSHVQDILDVVAIMTMPTFRPEIDLEVIEETLEDVLE